MRVFRLGYRFGVQQFNAQKNYYETLKVGQTASEKQIKTAFRTLAKMYHPDSNAGKEAQFKEINEAYQVLGDPQLKKSYDDARKFPHSAPHSDHSSSQSYSHHDSQQQSYYQSQQQSYQQYYKQNPKGPQYRGYQQASGWDGMSAREQVMYDIFRQQQAQMRRQKPADFSDMYEDAAAKLHRRMKEARFDNFHRMQEQARQAQMRQEEEDRLNDIKFREYKDKVSHDVADKLKTSLNELAFEVARHVKGAGKIIDFLKDIYDQNKKKPK